MNIKNAALLCGFLNSLFKGDSMGVISERPNLKGAKYHESRF